MPSSAISDQIMIAPSILSANFGRLAEDMAAVDAAGGDWIHVDIMDGRFVPNISFGPLVVEAVRRSTKKPLNVHLMIIEPERHLEAFAKAGADHLLVQAEPASTIHLHRVLSKIRALGKQAGVVLDPGGCGWRHRHRCGQRYFRRAGLRAGDLDNPQFLHGKLEAKMTPPQTAGLEISPYPDALTNHVAAWILNLLKERSGLFSLCPSGGWTPKRLYQRMAQNLLRDGFPWDRTHLFGGDERFVAPTTDVLSNFRMVKNALPPAIAIPDAHVHSMPTEGVTPAPAAATYQQELQSFYGSPRLRPGKRLFDVTLLGLGLYGHAASLFPGTPVLEEHEYWVSAVVGAKTEARLTLSYPALESSRYGAVLVAGEEKRQIRAAYHRGDDLPSTRLHPQGDLVIFNERTAQ